MGRNSYGQLGRKSRNEEFDIRFGKVEFPEGVKIQQIASGNHHLLAVDEKGLLYTTWSSWATESTRTSRVPTTFAARNWL